MEVCQSVGDFEQAVCNITPGCAGNQLHLVGDSFFGNAFDRMLGVNGLAPRTWLAFFCLALSAMGQSSGTGCRSIALTVELSAGKGFEKRIGQDLVFKVDPERDGPKGELSGWGIELVPARVPDNDYIYPVNPPLRFNGLQTLGPSYGDDTKGSLGHAHEMDFLLNSADYDRLWPLVTNALWPYMPSNPDAAADRYFDALKALAKGHLTITVQSYDADPVTDVISSIKFQAEFIAPESFAFDPALKPKLVSCSALAK